MPKPYTVSRSLFMDADAAEIYAHLHDFHAWLAWSPWEDVDPDMHRDFDGPDSGDGAHYTWSGNKKAGAGSMTITRAQRPSTVELDLHFERPFASDARLAFALQPEGSGTQVTWTMHGEHTGVMVLLSRVMSMDKLVGKDFEKGLGRLKVLVEGS